MAPNNKYDKIYTVTSVAHLIPIKLDLAKLNYGHWSKLFSTHCAGFDVLPFIQGTLTSEERSTEEWSKADSVVLSWIFLTISEPLLERVLNSEPKNAHDAWQFLATVFQDNKRAKTVELMAELKALDIGTQTVEEYFRKLDSLSTLLRNLGSKVDEDDLVTYAINGLNEKFPHASHNILHSNPFPSLATVRSMITLEEMQLNRKTRATTESLATPSSPTVLLAHTTTGNTRSQPATNHPQQVCRNFTRGFCRFADQCRYLHHSNRQNTSGNICSSHGNFSTGHSSNSTNSRPNGNSQAQLLKIIEAQQYVINNLHLTGVAQRSSPALMAPLTTFRNTGQQPLSAQQQYSVQQPFNGPIAPQANVVGPTQLTSPGQLFSQPIQTGPPGFRGPLQPTLHGQQPSFGPNHPEFSGTHQQPTYSQETIIPHAFSTTTLPDYSNTGWTMDTGASIHLTSSINNLSTIFNHCMYPSVAVGDGNSIPVVNTGHSVLPNINRPLHLSNVLVTPNIVKNLISVRRFTRDNKVSVSFDEFGFSVKDYLTRRLLLRCDSTRDLYPLTTPTPTPAQHALITTPSIWHQRLGHPSTDFFRRICSSNSISCTNNKSDVLCHACQLGKHVRLPFTSSTSHVTSLFDIVHSDLWTSPIPSLSGYKYYVIFLDHYSHYLWVFPVGNSITTKYTNSSETMAYKYVSHAHKRPNKMANPNA
ncbi:uncharacterized protein [Rutidosis leptorrhynchoides]|uniref:uncharacterized protein n=1 Tax=Rutidosis leptorrhynchoides TaxID=125765 RepID=UPI003A99CCFA